MLPIYGILKQRVMFPEGSGTVGEVEPVVG